MLSGNSNFQPCWSTTKLDLRNFINQLIHASPISSSVIQILVKFDTRSACIVIAGQFNFQPRRVYNAYFTQNHKHTYEHTP
jgi:hypothetical protein